MTRPIFLLVLVSCIICARSFISKGLAARPALGHLRLNNVYKGVKPNHFRMSLTSSSSATVEPSKNSSNNPPIKPGPVANIKRLLALSIVLIRQSPLRIQNALINVIRLVLGPPSTSSSNSNNRRAFLNNNGKRKSNVDIFKNLVLVLKQPRFWLRFSLAFGAFLGLKKYMTFLKSLTLEISYSNFLKLIAEHPEVVKNLRCTPSLFTFRLNGKAALTRVVNIEGNILDRLLASGIDFAAPPAPTNILGIIWTVAYAAFLWNITTRMMQGPQDDGAGRRKDKELDFYGKLSFNDVAGQEKAKTEVREICEMLKNPERYLSLGARLPAGILLVGPPGTGKTLLARVTAAEAGVPFFACSASDFVEVFVGRGPARVRKLFKQAADNAPCIVFIDELDSIGRSRRLGSMNSEQENTLNQLLTSMDGLDTSNNGVIVMAATNRYELLDPALLRSGRFDRIVQCPLPDRDGRNAILQVHTRKLRLATDVDLDRIAKFTPGTCGADLSAITNEAAIRAVRRGGAEVSVQDFENALKSFFEGRGASISLQGAAEVAGLQMPSWLSSLTGGGYNKATNTDPPAVAGS